MLLPLNHSNFPAKDGGCPIRSLIDSKAGKFAINAGVTPQTPPSISSLRPFRIDAG